MSEEEIKKLVCDYVCAEMELIPDMDEIPEHPPYSKRFNKKMKHILRAGEWFGGRYRLYTVLYRAAAIALIFLSLAAANQVSAAVFGIDPWKALNELFDPTVNMVQHIYHKDANAPKGRAKPISDVPTYVPEGYEVEEEKIDDDFIEASWDDVNKEDIKYGILYYRKRMNDGISIKENAEYDSVSDVIVCGYDAKIYAMKDENWIVWYDDDYRYNILTYGVENATDVIMRMAESVYEKK